MRLLLHSARKSSVTARASVYRSGVTLLLTFAPWYASSAGCGAQSTDSHRTNPATPPTLDQGEIGIELTPAGVRVVGEAGAVSPGGASVEIKNASTGETAATTAKANGSFVAELPGDLDDDYRVSATVDGETSSVSLEGKGEMPGIDPELYACLAASGAEVGEGATGGPQPVCSYLHAEAGCQASEFVASADRRCEVDADCVDVLGTPSCMDSCYGGAIVSQAGAATIAAGLDAIDASVCEDFDANECKYSPSGCPYPGPREPACVNGHCAAVTGCALGTRQGQRLLDAVAPELANGCDTDADCTAHVPFVCAWNCGSSPVFVSSANEAAYERALQDAQDACDSGAFTETCPIPACTPALTPGAMCQAGTCVERSSEALAQDIEAELDRLNHCETVEECESVAYPYCSTRYIAKGSERTQLDSWLSEYNATMGDIGCDGSCACGVLQCVDQRCTASPSNCMDVPEGGMNVCL